MTGTPSDDTKSIVRRLTPSQRTLAVALCIALLLAPTGIAVAQEEQPVTRWKKTTTDTPRDVAVTPDGDHVAISTNGGDIKLLNASDGSEVWSFHADDAIARAVTSGPDRIYYGIDGHVGALDQDTGSLVWAENYTIDTDGVPRGIEFMDGNAYTQHSTGLISWEGSTGNVNWKINESDEDWSRTNQLDAKDGVIYTASQHNDAGARLYRYDGSTGSELAASNFSVEFNDHWGIDVSNDSQHVYAASASSGTDNDDVLGMDADAGGKIWGVETDDDSGVGNRINGRHVASSPTDNVIFVDGLDKNHIRVMSASNGLTDKLWTTSGEADGLAISPDGSTLYAALQGSELWAIDTGGGHTVSGEVNDQRNQAVEGATIIANGSAENDSAVTAADGSYELTLLNGTYNLTAYKDGYINDTATVTVSGDVTQDFTLIEEDAALSIDARHYMEHGEKTPYSITYGEIDESGNFVRKDVTNETTVSSNNTTVVTVDAIATELVATSERGVNDQTYITANYTNDDGETFTNQHNVTVANKTVENLDILPPVIRFTATLDDKTMQTILIATGVAVVAAIVAGAFSGIAAFTVIMSMGWVMGIVPDGTIIVVVLTAAFIGMNVAGNVDYTVRR